LGEIVVVGGGLTGIIAIRILNNLGYRPILIEPDYVLGGLVRGVVLGDNAIDAFPIFLEDKDLDRLRDIGFEIDVIEVDLVSSILKHGPLKAKMWGYRRGSEDLVKELEDPWPLRWSNKMLYPRDGWSKLLSKWEGVLKFKWVHEGLRRVDLGGKKAKTYHGQVVSYSKLLYTLPLVDVKDKIGINLDIKPSFCHMIAISILAEGKHPFGWIIGYHGGTAILPHTIVYTSKLVGIEDYHSISALISYEGEGLPAGFLEQTISRLKKMNIIKPNTLLERVYIAKYACINANDVDSTIRKRVIEELKDKGIILVGRRALWKEMSIGELVENALNQIVSSL